MYQISQSQNFMRELLSNSISKLIYYHVNKWLFCKRYKVINAIYKICL